ncbi:2-C-methyl-D-erythritol 4-phosphate cytidylyltransferase [Thermodesulfobacterium hydrogeniphilum]|uniref:2-C-methyl-D-erythritol 4-phosphate cytidylyltransferase n=1 Tax=Thermodesulfobacterium hydrogeniphilum TaxID=161156 RepID=UPI000570DFD8|nr:2-C-methyl-D-erythritol 4-phosphate cytidylyltransferase [Thermodesulfobacterium hydrogeniphilum]
MVIAIIPAAGKGKRLGGEKPKQFLELKGIPIIIHTLFKFEKHPQIDGIIISTSYNYFQLIEKLINKYNFKKVLKIVEGGKTRQESVYNGVKACPEEAQIILVHDAVRPFVSFKIINDVIQASIKYGAAVPGIPVRDTLNKASKGKILQNIDRTGLFQIQTPQGVRAEILKECLKKAQEQKLVFSDESSLLLYYGYKVHLVNGAFINFKITYFEDLLLAEKLIDCKIETLLEN